MFTSFDRGGSCISSLFSLDTIGETATFISEDASRTAPYDRILLSGRTLLMPRTVTLAVLEQHLNPSGGTTYPIDTSESACPGP